MNNPGPPVFGRLKSLIPLGDDQLDRYLKCFNRLTVPAKGVLLKEGDTANKLFVIEKGCIRVWFNHHGKDITFQFFFEDNAVASIESFRKDIPSVVSIEAIEPCVVWWISKKDFFRIMGEVTDIPEFRDMLINGIFERMYGYMRHFLSSLRDTPEQRYLNLIKEEPRIIKRVPQHYIASYLGISKVHLSRIKGKLAKKKSSPPF